MLSSLGITAGHHDVHAGARDRGCRMESDSAGRASNQHDRTIHPVVMPLFLGRRLPRPDLPANATHRIQMNAGKRASGTNTAA